MIRETLDPASANAFLLVSAGKGLSFQRRAATGAATINTAGPFSGAPYWIRLDRAGTTITAYQSSDGVVWTLLGADTVSMGASVLIGLGVTSHDADTAATGAFDNVTVTAGTPASPRPWMHADIGSVGKTGTASFDPSTNVYTVKGAGADIWGNTDAFHYLYRPMTGDGAIVARVASVQNVNSWTKAGVMIRETLDPGSTNAFMLVSNTKGTSFQRRSVAGNATVNTAGPMTGAPYWVKLERSGATFNAYTSADGAAWTLVDSASIPMATTVYVGLATTSHNAGATATNTFDHVVAP
jgi:regulation of enolase protein 1 (concanavalin A-like superfamily)